MPTLLDVTLGNDPTEEETLLHLSPFVLAAPPPSMPA